MDPITYLRKQSIFDRFGSTFPTIKDGPMHWSYSRSCQWQYWTPCLVCGSVYCQNMDHNNLPLLQVLYLHYLFMASFIRRFLLRHFNRTLPTCGIEVALFIRGFEAVLKIRSAQIEPFEVGLPAQNRPKSRLEHARIMVENKVLTAASRRQRVKPIHLIHVTLPECYM